MSRPSTSHCARTGKTWMPGTRPGMTNEREQESKMNQPTSAYFMEERHEAGESHTLSVLVQNDPGVLSRRIGLFSGRGYTISSRTLSATEDQQHRVPVTLLTPV